MNLFFLELKNIRGTLNVKKIANCHYFGRPCSWNEKMMDGKYTEIKKANPDNCKDCLKASAL